MDLLFFRVIFLEKLFVSDTCQRGKNGVGGCGIPTFSVAHLRPQPGICRTDQSQDLSPCLTPLSPTPPLPTPLEIHPHR